MKTTSNIETGSLRTVQRALRLLEWVASQPTGPTVREAAESLELNVATSYHLVNTLTALGYLLKGEDRRLRLGAKVAALHQAFHQHLQLSRDLLPLLQDLSNETRETAYLSAWDRGDVVLQTVVESVETLRVTGLYVGLRGAAYCRASGKAILAYLDSAELEAYLCKAPFEAHTRHTIVDANTLRVALEKIRVCGYAIDDQEFALGVCCVAAPYFGVDTRVKGAVTVSMPSSRFDESRPLVCRLVLEAGRRASLLLGYGGPYPRDGVSGSRVREGSSLTAIRARR